MSNLTPVHGYHCASCNTFLPSPVEEYPTSCYIIRMGRSTQYGSVEKTYLYCGKECAQKCEEQLEQLADEYINRGSTAPLFNT